MNNTPPRGSGVANSPDEEVILVVVGALALSALVGSVGLVWVAGARWLVEHHVLVPAAAHPLLEIPGAAGAGLEARTAREGRRGRRPAMSPWWSGSTAA